MGIRQIKVLLVGGTAKNSLGLMSWLYKRGCQCDFATSFRDACNLISHTQFDLVLSQYHLPDRTAFPLLDRLSGSSATLFFSTAVEDGCLWLPMLERGKRCVGAPLLRSSEFTGAVAEVLKLLPTKWKRSPLKPNKTSFWSSLNCGLKITCRCAPRAGLRFTRSSENHPCWPQP